MTIDQENKWRDEFEKTISETPLSSREERLKRLPNQSDVYFWNSIQFQWDGYLAGRKKAQEELKDKDDLIIILKMKLNGSKEKVKERDETISEYEKQFKTQNEIIKDRDKKIESLEIKIKVVSAVRNFWLESHAILSNDMKKRDELIKEAMLWLIDELEDRKIIDHSNGVGIGAYQMKLGNWIEKAKKLVGEK